jgi:hypothetical protein
MELGARSSLQEFDSTRILTPMTDAMLRDPSASDRLMWRCTYNGWATARSTRSTNPTLVSARVMEPDISERAPIVYNGTKYLVAPAGLQWNNNLFKNDRAAAVNSNRLLGEGKSYTQIASAIGIFV